MSIRSYLIAGWNSQFAHYRDVQFGGDVAMGCVGDVGLPVKRGVEVRYSPDFTPSSELPNVSITNDAWHFCFLVTL